jgi:DNA-binding response OmpR family regulator
MLGQSTKKEVEVVSKSKKYSISGVKVKTETGEEAQYKTLLIRFARFDDPNKKEVTVDGEVVKLTPIEYELLKFLLKNSGLSSAK